METESNSRLISLIKKSLTYYGLDQPIPEHNKNDKMEILKVLNLKEEEELPVMKKDCKKALDT